MSANEVPHTLGDYLGILRRRRIYFLTLLPACLLLAVFIAYVLTPDYRSSATILLEASSIPKEFVQTSVTNYADQQIELVQRRVMTMGRLEQLVKEFDPYPERHDLSTEQKAQGILDDTVIERVDPITLEVVKASNAFSIHYNNLDPERAAGIAQRLADLFLDYSRRTRNETAGGTYDFLLAQSQDLERRMAEVDQQVADFKARHGEALPEAQFGNQSATERLERELLGVESQIRVADERRSLLEIQLSKLSPTLAGTAGNWRTELATLQGQLAEARVKYTPDHPDVKRLQRQIEALSARVGAESGPGAVVPDNPEYQTVASQLAAAQREVAALQSNAARTRAEIQNYEQRLVSAPAVEREYMEISRQRDVLRDQYQDIQNKLREADIGRSLEGQQKGDRFTQIRAPFASTRPFSPNRIGIILLGMVLGAGLAAGLAALAESADPSIRGVRDLSEITAVPVMGSIPVLTNAVDRRKRMVWWSSYAVALVLATVVVAITVVSA